LGDNFEQSLQILVRFPILPDPVQMDVAGFRFHALKGGDKGRFSVWASENYRITFGWNGEDAIEVDLEDYH
jgi:toxin HigB-1